MINRIILGVLVILSVFIGINLFDRIEYDNASGLLDSNMNVTGCDFINCYIQGEHIGFFYYKKELNAMRKTASPALLEIKLSPLQIFASVSQDGKEKE